VEDEEVYGLPRKAPRLYERYIDDYVTEKCESRMKFTFEIIF